MEQLAKSLATTKSIHQQASLSRFFTGVKKAKVEIPDELILYTRLPPELYSGVKHITPLSDNDNNNNNNDVDRRIYYREIDDMMDCVELLNNELEGEDMDVEKHSQIEGLLVDPPWEYIIEDGRNDGLCKWNLNQVSDLLEKVLERMSAGLIFMWTHKLIQGDVIRMMSDLGCKYVENLVWFKKSINNLPMNEPYPYFSSTKEILLMFKKGDGIDLRHQRSPDVIIDFEQPPSQWIHEEYTEPKPSAVFTMIETLLPQGAYNDKIKRGRFVELWAKRSDTRRQGWFAFHQRKDVNANLLEEMSLDDTLTQPCQNTTS
ncbi:hypothetical protein BC941DRAFT_416529 [Chlamydoabsidia padenii]|nr:hypothetical protein BC941DRAFT_416529 [Chlamydoabsidia padenii]